METGGVGGRPPSAHEEDAGKAGWRTPGRAALELVILAALAGAVVGVLLWGQQRAAAARMQAEKRLAAEAVFQNGLEQLALVLAQALDVAVADPRLAAALAGGDTERLREDWGFLHAGLAEKYGAACLTFCDGERVALWRAHRPDVRGDVVRSAALQSAERIGRADAGLEVGRDGEIALRVARAVEVAGSVVGYVEAGVDVAEWLHRRENPFGGFWMVALHKEQVERELWVERMARIGGLGEWDSHGRIVVGRMAGADAGGAVARALDAELMRGSSAGEAKLRGDVDGQAWRAAAFPLRDATGMEVGVVLAVVDAGAGRSLPMRGVALGGLIAGGLLAALLAVALGAERRAATEKRLREAALSGAERRMVDVLDCLPCGVVAVDLETGCFAYANEAMGRMLGRRPEEIAALGATDVHPPEDRPRIVAWMEACMRGGGGTPAGVSLLRKDGQLVAVEPIHWFAQLGGRPCLLVVWTDVSDRARAERALQDSRTKIEAVLDNVNDVVWSASYPDFKPIFVSASVERLYGRPREAFFHNPLLWAEAVHPDDRKRVEDAKRELAERGFAYRECRIVRPDGQIRWVADRSKLACDEDGRAVRVDGVATDVTARKFAEQRLALLAAVVDQSDDAIAVKDADLRVVAANPAYARAWGRKDARDLVGKTEAEIAEVSPQGDSVRASMEDDRRAQQLPPGQFVLREECAASPAGEIRHLRTKKYPIFDANRHLLGTGGVAADVTAQKRAEHALRLSEELFKSLVANVPGAIYRCRFDRDWTMLFLSRGAQELFGYAAEDFLGNAVRSFASIIHPGDAAEVDRAIRDAVDRGEAWEVEYRVRRADGTCLRVRERGRAVFGADGSACHLDGFIAAVEPPGK